MDSRYDFQNLERELSSIEQQLQSFEKSLESTVDPVMSARFNDQQYGDRAVEKKVDEIINDSKRRIERKYNEYLNGVRRSTYDSTERIKREAMVVSQKIERLNSSLSQWATLNKAFESKDYQRVISTAESIDTTSFDEELFEALLLLKLESYDALCKEGFESLSFDNYENYLAYFLLCKKNSARSHLVRSAKCLLQASSMIVDFSISEPKQQYGFCLNGLEAYRVLPDAEKAGLQPEYQKCYSNGIRLYNRLCATAYSSFDYLFVKELLADSELFESGDIKEAFFRDGKSDAKTLFEYYCGNGQDAPIETVEIVFDDTRSLLASSEKDRYVSYWMTRYDDHGLKFVDTIVNGEEDKLSVFSTLVLALLDKGTVVSREADCLLDLATLYHSVLLSMKDTINLWVFLKNAVLWNEYIKRVQSNAGLKNEEGYKNGSRIIDDITFSMVSKYKKLCNGFEKDLVSDLNTVMDATSIRLFGKRYIKNLKCSEENSTSKGTTVKLITMELKAATRKKLIIGGIIAAAVIVAIIVIIILGREGDKNGIVQFFQEEKSGASNTISF